MVLTRYCEHALQLQLAKSPGQRPANGVLMILPALGTAGMPTWPLEILSSRSYRSLGLRMEKLRRAWTRHNVCPGPAVVRDQRSLGVVQRNPEGEQYVGIQFPHIEERFLLYQSQFTRVTIRQEHSLFQKYHGPPQNRAQLQFSCPAKPLVLPPERLFEPSKRSNNGATRSYR